MVTDPAPRRPSSPPFSATPLHRVLRLSWTRVPWYRRRRTPWDDFCAHVAADQHLRDWLLG
jgi:hypothetical protein